MLSQAELHTLLEKLCVDLGFCLPPDEHEGLVQNPPSTIDEFAVAVFIAEGLDPATAPRSPYRQVRAVVAEAFQTSSSFDDEPGNES